MILDAVHSLTTGVIVLLAIAFFLGFVFGFAIRSYISYRRRRAARRRRHGF